MGCADARAVERHALRLGYERSERAHECAGRRAAWTHGQPRAVARCIPPPAHSTGESHRYNARPGHQLSQAMYLISSQPSTAAQKYALCPFFSVSRALSASRFSESLARRLMELYADARRDSSILTCVRACAPGPDHDRIASRSEARRNWVGTIYLIIPCVRARRGCYCYRASPA